MVWQIFSPKHPLLKPLIQGFWMINEQVPYQKERILPTGTIELIINFGGDFRLWDRDNPEQFTTSRDSWLVGLHTLYLINEPLGKSQMLGIRFHPHGFYPFFPCDAHELHNQVLSADAIFGRDIHFLREALYQASNIGDRLRLLENFLIKRLHDLDGMQAIYYAANCLATSQGKQSIKSLAEHIGISQKHLAHRFRQVVGVTPKTLARIYRFQASLASIKKHSQLDWAEIALHCHYYDQAHFNKDFAAFTGFSPSQYWDLLAPYFQNETSLESTHFVPIG